MALFTAASRVIGAPQSTFTYLLHARSLARPVLLTPSLGAQCRSFCFFIFSSPTSPNPPLFATLLLLGLHFLGGGEVIRIGQVDERLMSTWPRGPPISPAASA